MLAGSPIPPLDVLAVTSDMGASEQLKVALNGDYVLHDVNDAAGQFISASSAIKRDIIVIVRDSIDLTYLEQIRNFIQASPTPVMIFVNEDPDRLAAIAIRYGITSFIVAGFEARRVPTLIEVTLERFKLHEALRNEVLKSQEELATRKVIERAKGILMEKKNLNEQEAYRSLRELAMRQSKPLKEVAETLILYSDLLP